MHNTRIATLPPDSRVHSVSLRSTSAPCAGQPSTIISSFRTRPHLLLSRPLYLLPAQQLLLWARPQVAAATVAPVVLALAAEARALAPAWGCLRRNLDQGAVEFLPFRDEDDGLSPGGGGGWWLRERPRYTGKNIIKYTRFKWIELLD